MTEELFVALGRTYCKDGRTTLGERTIDLRGPFARKTYHELVGEHRFPDGRPYVVPHRYALFSRTEQAPIRDQPGVGEHSREVLAEAGLSPAEIEALIEQKVVIENPPFVVKVLVNYR